MTARIPEPAVLRGRVIELSPIAETDLLQLYAAIGRPEVFASGYGGGPAGYRDTLEGFVDFAHEYYVWGGPGTTFVARAVESGEVVGTSTLSDLDLVGEAVHLGWTAWAPSVWGTAVNPEAKLLMLDHAFAHGFGRVKLQADMVNTHSRAAIAKLGATFEGVARRDKIRADGTWRDSAVFSIIVDEWPEVRANLVSRIDALRA
ncbi:N-acetyltransferase [Herbiconiux sp. L3-i23]|nr:N-acetyltransferase [Herbiconiux sp. L3-i23]